MTWFSDKEMKDENRDILKNKGKFYGLLIFTEKMAWNLKNLQRRSPKLGSNLQVLFWDVDCKYIDFCFQQNLLQFDGKLYKCTYQ